MSLSRGTPRPSRQAKQVIPRPAVPPTHQRLDVCSSSCTKIISGAEQLAYRSVHRYRDRRYGQELSAARSHHRIAAINPSDVYDNLIALAVVYDAPGIALIGMAALDLQAVVPGALGADTVQPGVFVLRPVAFNRF